MATFMAVVLYTTGQWCFRAALSTTWKGTSSGPANTSYCTCRLLFRHRTCNLYQTVLYIRLPITPDDIRVSSVVSYS